MRILAVDDEPFILELFPKLAAKAGFPEVTTCSSAALALDLTAQNDRVFDCFVLDINMPGMDGIELCSRLRQLDTYRRTPILMLTAMYEREFLERAFKAGATDYATKPFDINELGARLRIAQELVVTRRKRSVSIGSTSSSDDRANDLDLIAANGIDGVKYLVEIDAFKNYLKQASRAGLAASQMVAIKIDTISRIYASASPEEFIYALDEVTDALHQALGRNIVLFSYAGNGLFIVLLNSASRHLAEEAEAEVQHLLDEKSSEYDNGSPMDIEVSIGSPIQPDYSNAVEPLRVIARAVARAESRSDEKRGQTPKVNIRRL